MNELLEVGSVAIRHIARKLAEEFAGVFSPQTVERFVGESFDALSEGARITGFLLILPSRSHVSGCGPRPKQEVSW